MASKLGGGHSLIRDPDSGKWGSFDPRTPRIAATEQKHYVLHEFRSSRQRHGSGIPSVTWRIQAVKHIEY